MKQNNISRLESPDYGKATLSSLRRIADAFDVALVVRLVPFNQYANWLSGTPFVDFGLNSESMAVPSFVDEERAHEFQVEVTEEIRLNHFYQPQESITGIVTQTIEELPQFHVGLPMYTYSEPMKVA